SRFWALELQKTATVKKLTDKSGETEYSGFSSFPSFLSFRFKKKLLVKTVIEGKAFQVAFTGTFQVGGIQQFVVQVTQRSVMLFHTQVHFVDGVVSLLVIHQKQVVFQDDRQYGVDQLPAVVQNDVERLHNGCSLLCGKIFILNQLGQFFGVDAHHFTQHLAGFLYPPVVLDQ